MTASTPTSPVPRWKRWRRRVQWALAIFIGVAILMRAVISLTLPTVLRQIAGGYGMTCDYDRLQLNLFNGDANLWGVRVLSKEGGEPILVADYCHGIVSVFNLLRLRLYVWRVEADGVEVNIQRNADGSVPLLEKLAAANSTNRAIPATPESSTAVPAVGGAIDLSPPLKVDAFRLQHVRVQIRDESVSPPLQTELAMDVRLSNLGSDAPAKFELNVSSDPLLDSLQVIGEGHSGGKVLDASLRLKARGIRFKEAAAYLEPLGIHPVADGVTVIASGEISTAARPDSPTGIAGSLQLDHISAIADRKEALALDQLTLDASAIEPGSIHLTNLTLTGIRGNIERGADGHIGVAGLEWNPHSMAPRRESSAPSAVPAAPTNSTKSSLLGILLAEPWRLDEIALRDLQLRFHDDSMSPPAELSLVSEKIAVHGINHDPNNLDAKATLDGVLQSPNLIGSITLAGDAQPFAAKKTFNFDLKATDIRPAALQPYFDQLGIESQLQNGQFHLAINGDMAFSPGGALTANVQVPAFVFSDKQDLFRFDGINFNGIGIDPADQRVSARSIEIHGPTFGAGRAVDGGLTFLGLHKYRNAVATAVSPSTSSPFTPAIPSIRLPKLQVDHFVWKDIHIHWLDESLKPANSLATTEAGIEVTNFNTDPPLVVAQTPAPGEFRAWLSIPQLTDEFSLSGTMSSSLTGMLVDAKLAGRNITAAGLAPYLKAIGIEPTLHNGKIEGAAMAQLESAENGVRASILTKDLRFTDDDVVLAGIDGILVSGVGVGRNRLGIDAVEFHHPYLPIARDSRGDILVVGLRIHPAIFMAAQTSAADPPPTPEIQIAAPPLTPGPVVSLNRFLLDDAQIDWADQYVPKTVETTLTTNVLLNHLTLGRAAGPANLRILVSATGIADEIAIAGRLQTAPDMQTAVLEINTQGMRAGPLEEYLPPGTHCTLKDGRVHMMIGANCVPNPDGGKRCAFELDDLNFQDAAGPSLFKLESIKAVASRIDPDKALAIDELSVNGIETGCSRTEEGGLRLLGFVVNPPPPGSVSPAPSESAPNPPAQVPIQRAASAADLLAVARRPLPLVTIDKAIFDLRRLSISDEARPSAKPLVVQDLIFQNADRISWLGPNPHNTGPGHFKLTGKIVPVADDLSADVYLTPFSDPLVARADWTVGGIQGKGLIELIPEIQNQVDGSKVTAGQLTGHVETQMRLHRRRPTDFDLSNGFGLSFLMHDLEYRAEPKGPVLAGLKEVRCDDMTCAGDGSLILAKSLEINRPTLKLWRDKEGLHVLGWIVKVPLPPASPSGSSPSKGRPTEIVSAAPVVVNSPARKPRQEIRIDEILMTDLDARYEDTFCDPPVRIPLNGMDVEVHGLSSLAPYEDRPIRFSAILNADKVNLPSDRDSSKTEQRDFFSQIAVNGDVSLYPQLHGWAKSSVNGLELAALKGEAKEAGLTLNGGLYDSTTDLRFKPDGSIDAGIKLNFTDLSLSEPPNGPISRLLKLPAPLDVAIGAVQSADGSITLPLDVPIEHGKVSQGAILAAAGGAVTSVIVNAIAATPFKAVGGIGSLLGAGSDKKPDKEPPIAIGFASGSADLNGVDYEQLNEIIKRMRNDTSLTLTIHSELGDGDVQWAALRANPSPEDCRGMEYQLRVHKAELLQTRTELAGQARAQLIALGEDGAADSLARLRSVERDLAHTEESLDQVCDLLRPGADRQSDRRTRAASIEIGQARLDAVNAYLLSSNVLKIKDRIDIVSARFNAAAPGSTGHVSISVVPKND